MTDQQLRVLRRKHLLVIVRDLEEALQNAIHDKEQLMLAYQCGLGAKQEENSAYTESQPEPDLRQPMYLQQYAARHSQPRWPIQQQSVYPQQYVAQYAQPQWPVQQQPAYPQEHIGHKNRQQGERDEK